ncbi:hypothetical protein GCM10010219_25800 [Streptomyces netropsis]|nr:hypothetical protein GCM10010219_25800 [Streptomyces netropsis]
MDGILHSAGVLRDGFILKKSAEDFSAVLAPKVSGLVHLDSATQDADLDFLVLFSSFTGAFGNVGQADYAAANAFMDAYAGYRNGLVAQGRRRGRTVSVNWPLWADGGMHVEPGVEQWLRAQFGLVPLREDTGVRALYRALAAPDDQVLVLEGDRARMRDTLLAADEPESTTAPRRTEDRRTAQSAQSAQSAPEKAETAEGLAGRAEAYFKKQLSSVINLPPAKIDAEAVLDDYGVDSVMTMDMTRALEEVFGSLSKTLFFEHRTIEALAGHFLDAHPDRMRELLSAGESGPGAGGTVRATSSTSAAERQRTWRTSVPVPAVAPARAVAPEAVAAGQMDIAIVGLAGRYPQARDVAEFWENLAAGRDSVTEIPESRWDHGQFFDPRKDAVGKAYSRWGGFLDGAYDFDPLFFNISPREAEIMDPQERLFLQCVHETLEDAGYTRGGPKSRTGNVLDGRVGVFVGVMYEEYQLFGAQNQVLGGASAVAGSSASIANRVSHVCGFHGPSMSIDTMCSSSLTAVHLACQSIKCGESEVAIAGGVNLSLHPNKYLLLSQGKFASSDGRCRSFGAGGDGYVPGEGVGAVLLKPLARAIADGDRIYGVIKGTSVNHGGGAGGYTVPNPKAQSEVIGRALETAGVGAREVSYIEAHGTGTALGDPIEITGLSNAFREHTGDKQFCAIGSVKSNIGHAESASGIAGITKVLLQMRHGKLAPSLHAETLNPHIDFADTPFVVQRELADWDRPVLPGGGTGATSPRVAGVSSFGAGGSNAHVVLAEYVPDGDEDGSPVDPALGAVVPLSARTEDGLRAQAENLLEWLERPENAAVGLADVAYTLQVGREAMEERLGVLAASVADLVAGLRGFLTSGSGVTGDVVRGSTRRDSTVRTLLSADADLSTMVSTWADKGKYDKLLELWANGVPVDWRVLYNGRTPRRIGLPTYPFARERYFPFDNQPLTAGEHAGPVRSPAGAPAERARPLVFVEDWEPEPLPESPARRLGSIVCLCSGSERQAEVARAVRALDPDARVAFVGQGTAFRRISPDSYEVRKAEAGDYADAFAAIAASHGGVDAVLDLWRLESGSRPDDVSEVVLALQALARTEVSARRFVLAGQYRDGVERAHLEAAIGFERSLGLVLPQPAFTVVLQDAADPQRPVGVAGWVERLVAELRQETASSALYRDGGRFVSRVRQTEVTEAPSVFKRGGTYLITGGLGGLGLIVAEHLTRSHGANVVLTGRSAPDARRQEKLRELGADKVLYTRADVCDAGDVKRVLAEARERFGSVHGVIHAAGVEGGGSILDKSVAAFEQTTAAKVAGTLALDEVLAGEVLDFVCYFSSTSAVIGDFGTCDYAFGNRFQTAYAAHRGERNAAGEISGKTVVINWPLWRDGGMGLDEDASELYLRSSGQDFLETRDGLRLFESLLAQDAVQHMVVVGEPSRVHRFLGLLPPPSAVAADEPSADEPSAAEPSAASVAPRPGPSGASVAEGLDQDLRDIICRVVKVSPDRVHEDDSLSAYGFDSVGLVELAAGIGRRIGVEITPSVFFSHPTLGKLRNHLLGKHTDVLEALYGTAPATTAVEPAQAPVVPVVPVREETTPAAQVGSAPRARSAGSDDAVAIIGMSGRFPGARDVDELWSVLSEGRDVISPVGAERLALWGEEADSPLGAFRCGQLSGPEEFDPLFFEISPKEARSLDPRQRLLLQESWRALEDAAWKPGSPGKVGMFVGVEHGDYEGLAESTGSITANHDGVLAARLAHFLDFTGPVLAINTACSSGLVAAHQACLSIRDGECDTALAAGVSLITTPRQLTDMQQAGMLSEDGVCYAFDERANGMVVSEAVAVVVLKRLSAAIADGDRIHGVIRASGINYDGRSHGITAPNGAAQVELLRSTYEKYDIDPAEIDYLVAHGTGTRLGDPVEVNALNDAFTGLTGKRRYCALTSVKPNVGHTLAASGLVSLIGILQAMRHETIPAGLHCERESTYIDWQDSPFFLNRANRQWPRTAGRERVAALSAFGMSGTNAHMVVESFVTPDNEHDAMMPAHVFAVSAKDPEALRQRVADLVDFLDAAGGHSPRHVSATLLDGRAHFRHRCAVVARDTGEAARLFRDWLGGAAAPDVVEGSVPKGFVPRAEVLEAGNDLVREATLLRHDRPAFAEALRAVAKLYCQGHDLDWRELFGGGRPTPVSLPGYPFAKRRCWPADVARLPAAVQAEAVEGGTVDDVRLRRVIADSGSGRGFDDDLLCGLLVTQLQALGMAAEGSGSVADLRDGLKPGRVHSRWLDESLRFLAEHGYLELDAERYALTPRASAAGGTAWRRWAAVCRESGSTNPYVNLMDQAIRACPDVLSGRSRGTDVIFPGASTSLVEGVYRHCDSAEALNEIVAEQVADRVEALLAADPGRRVRVLEIGAGTGGTTDKVLRALSRHRDGVAEYCYTDVSAHFLRTGKKEFGAEHPYLRYEHFDVERSPAGQGLAEGAYDIVLATNVLHATGDVRAAVRHARALLGHDGTLVLNELAARTLFSHLTFGLLDGWWLYRDPELRIDGCPALEPDRWRSVLHDEGFAAVSFPAAAAHDAGHQVVVARTGAGAPTSDADHQDLDAHAPDAHGPDAHELDAHVRREIVAQLRQALELEEDEIHVEDSFADYGVDSIVGVQLVRDLNEILGGVLEPTDLFDHSSVRRLAAYVTETFPAQAGARLARPEQAPRAALPTVAAAPAAATADAGVARAGNTEPHLEPIAIIGMSGRFGRAESVDRLWEHLANGDSLVGEITRWDISRFVEPGADFPRHASLMNDIDRFDPAFFQISGVEATYMDPQQRIALEESWRAFEDAGYAGAGAQSTNCGVYIGTQPVDYLPSPREDAPAQAMWGNAESIMPARISYHLDLRGPAVAVDTACSGSLVAVHLACQALRAGEVEMALAGGVSVQCAPHYYLQAHRAGMLSPTGRCHTFDERADGFVPGDGVGFVVLKRLRDALADGDHIHGLVRGSGLNQDGTSNGITAPSAKSQEQLQRAVYDKYGVDPADLGLVEAHGTGTRLGDPIEFQALTRAFRGYTDKREYCAIGSVKTNIGHTSPTAGVSGLIKILLALRHREIPRSLNFEQGNAHIDFAASPFYVNTVHRDWTTEAGRPRLAALNSFGFSGTNAHMVVEEAPVRPRDGVRPSAHLVTLSALSHEQLRTQAEQLADHLRAHPDTDLGDVSLTLLLGRRHCAVRLACVARTTDELADRLREWLSTGREEHVRVADLSESRPSGDTSQARRGNSRIRQCAAGASESDRVEHLAVVRDLYLQGCELEYAELFAAGAHRRTPLPTYPFSRQRYWLPEAVEAPSRPPAARVEPVPAEHPAPPADGNHLTLAPVWVRDQAPAQELSPQSGVVVFGADATERAGLAAAFGAPAFLDVEPTLGVAALTARLRGVGDIRHLVWISRTGEDSDATALLRRTDAGVVVFFRLIKALLALGHAGADLTWTVVTRQTQPVLRGERVHPADAGVLGLAGVMAKELPNWRVNSLDLGAGDALPVSTLIGASSQPVRALRGGQWFRQRLVPAELAAPSGSPYTRGGVYVVLGGAGGLGEIWSEDVIRRFGAQVVWIGRRELDDDIQRKIDRLAALGPAPWYVRADAADRESLAAAHALIKQRFGTVDGVVHSVFGLVDQSLPNTEEQRFRSGLSAKLDASAWMAEVFDADDPDFMLFFSSISSLNPAMGYCSYVAGSAVEDALSHRLSAERPYPVRVVNWGYWGAVGSGLDVPQHIRERLYEQEGLADIDPALAMATVERLLTSPLVQVAHLNTRKPEKFESFDARESVRVLGPSVRTPALTPALPSRADQVQAVRTGTKAKAMELDEVLARLLWCDLNERGWFGRQIFDVASFMQDNGVLDGFDRWVGECFAVLTRFGHLKETGSGSFTAAGKRPDAREAERAWERGKRVWLADPELRATADLVDRTFRVLPEILTGTASAVEVIFPGSSLELVEGIYKRNMIADHFNDVVGDCVVELVERSIAENPDAQFRIFEVGAGTGGTTATLMRRLKPYARNIGEYCYTDMSNAFLIHGTREFGEENPFLRCRLFDAGKPVAEQGFTEGAYDLVVATNVLHATRDIRESLRNAKALMKPGAAVVINEIDGYTPFSLLTFALLDGWWLYDDPELRTEGGPALAPGMWQSVLEWEGYGSVEFPAADAHVLGQQVVVAYSDGVIHQARGGEQPDAVEPPAPVTPAVPQASMPAAQQTRVDPEPLAETRVDPALLKEAVLTYLKDLVARTLMIPADSIRAGEPLSTYGIDSILILQLLNGLQKDLGEVGSTLFFEYRTVGALADHFVTERQEDIARVVGLAPQPQERPAPAPAEIRPVEPRPVEPRAVTAPARAAEPQRERAARPRRGGDIAIIGMSARFPQAGTLDEFWAGLRSGRDSITEIPADRWRLDGFYEADKDRAADEGKSYSKWGGFLDGFADFDPLFFAMTPNEAVEVDPQERLFLQETWKAFEDAGYTRARLEQEHGGRVGVFVGITRAGHNLYGPERWQRGDTTSPYTSFGSVANRVSFKLNLNGPSMPIDTMCSSSLTALHEACEHLLRDECELAVTGGVNLYLHPSGYVGLSRLQMLSDDGKCRSFGRGGNGFVPGEGVGALILKRLDDAERDNDRIHAVIRATGVNHGGTTNGYTVPNPVAQGNLIRRTLDKAGIDAGTISYVEAHGTGTALGDPIEINGLKRAFSDDTQDTQFCAIGSVKSNIGHAEAAAGVAGVCKVVLQMRHGELAPTLHADEVNPHIDFASSPFVVQRERAAWQRPVVDVDGVAREVPRRAGVSSFGAGGANAHVLIEEYRPAEPRSPRVPDGAPAVVVLSAMDGERLREQASALLQWLSDPERGEVPLADVAYTLQVGREAMPERLGTVVGSLDELAVRLRGFLDRPEHADGVHRSRVNRNGGGALTADEGLGEVVAAWIAKGEYAKVLDLWVNGFDIDWRALHVGADVRPVSLPAYPFARERYWVAEEGTGRPDDAADPDGGGPRSQVDDVLDDYLNGSLDLTAAAEMLSPAFTTAPVRTTENGGAAK